MKKILFILFWVQTVGLAAIDHGSLFGKYDDDHPQYVRKDGTRPLDADWAAGPWTISCLALDVNDLSINAIDVNDLTVLTLQLAGGSITDTSGSIDFEDTDWIGVGSMVAGDFTSVVVPGTAPFYCDSTTVCANLNADLLDGEDATSFQDAHANLTSLSGLSYTSTAFIKLTAANTFGVDTNTYLTAESDPVFTAWDKSTGISITESQITDLQSYYKSGDSPVFAATDCGSSCEADAYTVGGVSGISGTYPVYNDGTPGNLTSITITNGIITGVTTAP